MVGIMPIWVQVSIISSIRVIIVSHDIQAIGEVLNVQLYGMGAFFAVLDKTGLEINPDKIFVLILQASSSFLTV